MNIFLRDRASNTTTLASVNLNGSGGGDGNSVFGGVSTNGRYVLFESDADDLIAGDTNGLTDIFVRDQLSGTTTLVSVAGGGGSANGASSMAVMTPDGRSVSFVSAATNLVAGDANGIADVFVRDLVAGTTRLASAGATIPSGRTSAGSRAPVITPDGRYVAFVSTASGLAAGTPAAPAGEVYVRDLVANTTVWASTNAASLASTLLHYSNLPTSYHPAISDDGRFVAFKTGWTNGTATPPSGSVALTLVLQFDATSRLTTVVGTNAFPAWAYSDDVFGPEMTPDGRYIAFVAREATGTAVASSVRLWDRQTETNLLVSANSAGAYPSGTVSRAPAVSPDGMFVAFLSDASGLVGNITSNGFHIYLRDIAGQTTRLIDADTNGVGSTDVRGAVPALSADGNSVAFSSPDGSLVAADRNRADDAFVRDIAAGTTEMISLHDAAVIPQTATGVSLLGQFSLSDDGRRLAFASQAGDLAANDANGAPDVFVRDLAAGTNCLASVGTNGLAAGGGFSHSPVLSAGGRYVAFVSTATNLAAGAGLAVATYNNIYLRDLEAATTALVSVSASGFGANNDSWAPVVSRDGRSVAFLSKATNLVPGVSGSGPNTYWRNLISGTTVALTANASVPQPPSMSADGRYVSYFSSASLLSVRDTQTGSNVFTLNAAGNLTSAALSPAGDRLLYTTSTTVFAVDLAAQSNLFAWPCNIPIQSSTPWSADGRFCVVVTTTNAQPGDLNGTNDVYLCDLATHTLDLVSVNASQSGSGNGPSDAPAISGDGRFVVYRSYATDLVSDNTNPPPNLYLFDRFTGSNRLLTVAAPGGNWSSWPGQPAINGDGRVVALQSWASGFVPEDLNRVADVFAVSLSPWGITDTDGDGIPDLWMIHYFGHPTAEAADRSLAGDDADGDSMSNLQEYLAGTDPTDINSVLRTRITTVPTSDGAMLTWLAVPGRDYRVQYKHTLADPDWMEEPGHPQILGTRASFSVPATDSSRFYRVVQ